MHTTERIIMWSVIAVLVFLLFFRNSSGFIQVKANLMDLSEFDGLPQEVKNAYSSNMTLIMKAVNNKFSQQWNALSLKDKDALLKDINETAKKTAAQIEQTDLTQVAKMSKDTMKMAEAPAPAVAMKDSGFKIASGPVPMGPVGMNMSSPSGMDLDKMKMQDQAKMKAQEEMKMQDQAKMGMKMFDPSLVNVKTVAAEKNAMKNIGF